MCAVLRRYRSSVPSPELRSGVAESAKMSAMTAAGGAYRLTGLHTVTIAR